MDEDMRPALTAQGFKDLEEGNVDDEEHLFVLRCIQSAEALELPYRTEGELADMLAWYQQVQTDFMLIEMLMRGDLYIVEGSEGEYTWKATPQGMQKAVETARALGEEIPEWIEDLPSLD